MSNVLVDTTPFCGDEYLHGKHPVFPKQFRDSMNWRKSTSSFRVLPQLKNCGLPLSISAHYSSNGFAVMLSTSTLSLLAMKA